MGGLGEALLPKLKTCGDCAYWQRNSLEFSQGFARAPCALELPKGLSEQLPVTRASFSCAGWESRKGHGGEENPLTHF
jgi:hypothetical protein